MKKFYLYFNNHFSAKAVVNAVMIKNQLGEPIPGRYSKAFLAAYPHLAGVVTEDTATAAELPTTVSMRPLAMTAVSSSAPSGPWDLVRP